MASTIVPITGIKGALSTVQLDVTDEKSIEEAAKHFQQQFRQLDVLMNNAGAGIGSSSEDPNVKTRFQLCLETNVMGPALVTATFRPLLVKS
jgi:NAD(P)-dependent dehydrogenase (short-subunit alcohol dehydrogenase family)